MIFNPSQIAEKEKAETLITTLKIWLGSITIFNWFVAGEIIILTMDQSPLLAMAKATPGSTKHRTRRGSFALDMTSTSMSESSEPTERG